MLADSQTYSICSENFMRIGQAVSEEFNHARRDTRISYIRRYTQQVLKAKEPSFKDTREKERKILKTKKTLQKNFQKSSSMFKLGSYLLMNLCYLFTYNLIRYKSVYT